jgi:cytochrome c-type biogenesis protein
MESWPLPVAAFIAGIISFLSPCVLPLVPGYVSLISGSSIDEIREQERRLLGTVMMKSLAFVLGFSIVFISLGAAATGLGQVTREYRSTLNLIAGIVIILFGLHLTGLLKIKALYADKRLHSVKTSGSMWGAFAVGFAFAFGWTPCIGPILAAILKFAYDQNTVGKGILLLAIYSAGLAVPFLLTSLGIERFLAFYSRFRRHLNTVEVASGVLLIAIGMLVVLNKFTILSGYLGFLNRFAL